MQSLLMLGRQPTLGLAEVESLFGANRLTPVGTSFVALDLPVEAIDFKRLGGSIRLADILGEVNGTDWKAIEKALIGLARSPALSLPASGKFHLGLSAVGIDVSSSKLNALGLTLKKVIRSRHDGSVRLAPNTEVALSTAQVFHHQLTSDQGCELLIVAHGSKTLVARTVAVQDIDSYTLRDRGRPKRDARVGMLPPKLAQIIINLAVGPETPSAETSVLDPFCGTGVVLQETLLMGYGAYGTDLEPRMIDYSRANLAWLAEQFPRLKPAVPRLEQGDATTHQWSTTPAFVACETYLGRPFTTTPARDVLEQTVSDVNLILKKFLVTIRGQLAPGTRLCLAVPAWQIAPGRFRHLPLIDSLADLGYTRVAFSHVHPEDLLYYREDQVVARELLVLTAR